MLTDTAPFSQLALADDGLSLFPKFRRRDVLLELAPVLKMGNPTPIWPFRALFESICKSFPLIAKMRPLISVGTGCWACAKAKEASTVVKVNKTVLDFFLLLQRMGKGNFFSL